MFPLRLVSLMTSNLTIFFRVLIQYYASHFTHGFFSTVLGQHAERVVLWPTKKKIRYRFWVTHLGGYVLQFVPLFDHLGSVPIRVNINIRVRVKIHRVLSQPVEIAIKMDSYHRGDVCSYFLVRMTQTRHVFFCAILPRDPDYLIAGKREVHHLQASRGQESIQFFQFRDHFDHCRIVTLRQFPLHGVETQLGPATFGSVIPDRFRLWP